MKAPARFETSRLVLTRPRVADARTIFDRYSSDADVTRYLSWPRHRTLADTEAFVAFSDREWERSPAGPYLIWSRNDQRLLGGTGLAFESAHMAITGYVLAKDSRGQGFATDALRAMVGLATKLGVVRLQACCHPDHRASMRVLEKCGFTHDNQCRGPAQFPNLVPGAQLDALCYAIDVNSTQ